MNQDFSDQHNMSGADQQQSSVQSSSDGHPLLRAPVLGGSTAPPPASTFQLLPASAALIAENQELGRNIRRTMVSLQAIGIPGFTYEGLAARQRALEAYWKRFEENNRLIVRNPASSAQLYHT